jgi:hypothetical protein
MNYYHEKTIELIETLGIKPKKIAEILGKSTSLVYSKMKSSQYHRFNRNDFELISEYINKNLKTKL